MRLIIIGVFLLVSITSYGQKKYKTVKNSLNLIHKEVYQIEKKSKIKSGFYYLVNTTTKDTLVIGNYENDIKTGCWKYFTDGVTPYLKYDFDVDSLKYYTIKPGNDSTYIKSGNQFILDKVDNPQIYIGFEHQALSELATTLKIPISVINSGNSGNSIYSFEIDNNGILNNIKIEQSINKEFDTQVINGLGGLRGTWAPARKNGHAVASKNLLIVEIGNNSAILTNEENSAYLWHVVMTYY